MINEDLERMTSDELLDLVENFGVANPDAVVAVGIMKDRKLTNREWCRLIALNSQLTEYIARSQQPHGAYDAGS